MGLVKHSQSSQNTSLQWLYNISKNKLEMEAVFLHADKYQSFVQHFGCQSFLQDDIIFIDRHD